MTFRKMLCPAVASLAAALATGPALAQDAYPTAKPITVVVAFPPGGVADLTARPIALISADPTILVVRSESPYKSVNNLVAAAKSTPGKINYSSSGYYGALHTPMAMFTLAAGINLFHVPYQGGGPAVTALLGGQVDALASGPEPVIRRYPRTRPTGGIS